MLISAAKETQGKVKRFLSNQLEAKLTSKYLVHRKYMLSSTKKILVATESELQLFPMNQLLEKTDTIPYSEILQIQLNTRDDQEFTIITKNNSNHTFACRERKRLMTEIYIYYTPYRKQIVNLETQEPLTEDTLNIQLQDVVIHQTDIYHEEDTAKQATFTISNSLIQLSYKQNQFGTILIDGQSETNQSIQRLATNYDPNFRQSSTYAKAQTSQSDRKSQGQLNENDTSKHIILFVEIGQIRTYETTMYLIKQNGTILKFIFGSVERLNKAVSAILMSSDAYLGHSIAHKREDEVQIVTASKRSQPATDHRKQESEAQMHFNEFKFLSDFFDFSKDLEPIYKTEALLHLDSDLPPIYVLLELNEEQVIVIEAEGRRVRAVGQLREMKFIFVNEDQLNRQNELSLCFVKKGGFIQEISLKCQSIEELICSIATLHQLIPNSHYNLEVLMHQPDFHLKIQGMLKDPDSEYESSVLRKFQYQGSHLKLRGDSPVQNHGIQSSEAQRAHLMDSLLLNTHFTQLPRLQGSAVRNFADLILHDIKKYSDYEWEHGMDEIYGDEESFDSELNDDSENSGRGSDSEENERDNEQGNSDYDSEEEYNAKHSLRNQANLIQNEKQKNSTLVELTTNLSRSLSLLKLSLNSPQFFKELTEEHTNLIRKLTQLLSTQNPTIGFMASEALVSFISYSNLNEAKQETLNKTSFINNKNLMVFQKLKARLYQQFNHYERTENLRCLQVFGLSTILSAFISKRKETTSYDDYQYLVSQIYNKDDQFKLLNLIDRFTMTSYFWLTLTSTQILNDVFGFLQRQGKPILFSEMQAHFMVFSIQLLHQIDLYLTSPLQIQKTQSLKFLTRFLTKNKDAVDVLFRIFRAPLFRLVETSNELQRTFAWEENEWQQFFKIILNETFNQSEVQWNQDTLRELIEALKREVYSFIKAKRKHSQTVQMQLKELTHPTHQYDDDHSIVTSTQHLIWNFKEFFVNYSVDQNLTKVGSFYLSRLLVIENNRPALNLKIKKQQLINFWDDLQEKFMITSDPKQRETILKVMILLYQRNYKVIEEFRTLPYWIQLLRSYEYRKSYILILQLIIQALGIQDAELASKNYEIFNQAEGVCAVFSCLSFAFSDLDSIENQVNFDQPETREDRVREFNPFENEKTYKLQLHRIESVQKKYSFENYTDCIITSINQQQNSKDTLVALLALEVIQIIITKQINAFTYPLPLIKQYLIQNQNCTVLSQLLLVQNFEISQRIISLIYDHLNSHYCLTKFLSYGIIEYLVLYLDSPLSNQAFSLLQKFQEVAFEYNTDLQLEEEFDNNDIRIIKQEENNSLDQSLFLRYLPLPLAMKAVSKEKHQEFLSIFREDSYEKATLIWNSQMRQVLKSLILLNSEKVISQLVTQARNKKAIGDDYEIECPSYSGPIKQVIKYKFIEEEVRCGQYYLRVWTQQASEGHHSERVVPRDEEERFTQDLQALMSNSIQLIKQSQTPESLEHHFTRLHIMLKANLKTLKTFGDKKTFALVQIRDICEYILAKEQKYNDQVKKILKLITKTFLTAMNNNAENLAVINKQRGMQIVYQIIKTILLQSQVYSATQETYNYNEEVVEIQGLLEERIKTPRGDGESDNSIDLPMAYEERKHAKHAATEPQPHEEDKHNFEGVTEQGKVHDLQIDKLDAKILQYCLECMDKLMQLDIHSFLSLSQEFKIDLFKQLSQILNIGYSIYQGFENQRKLQSEKIARQIREQQQQLGQTLILDQSLFPMSQLGLKLGGGILPQLNKLRYVEPTPINTSARQMTFNNFTSENKSQNKQLPVVNDQSYSRSNILRSTTKHFQLQSRGQPKTLQIDFSGEVQKVKERNQTMDLVFSLVQSSSSFIQTLSMNPILHPEMITSGLGWKAFQLCFFSMWTDDKKQFVEGLLKDAIKIMQNLTSFAFVFTHEIQTNKTAQDQSNAFFKAVQEKYEDSKLKDVVIEFWFCMKKLLERKILNNLVLQVTFDSYDSKITLGRSQDLEAQKFIKIFQIEEKSHELIWNNQSREELYQILKVQLASIDDSFFEKINEFDYQVNLSELRIESIFVKQFNSDIYYKPSDTNVFVRSLFVNLNKRMEKTSLVDLSEQQYDDVLEISKALRNLIQYQKVLDTKAIQHFLDNIPSLCQILRLKDIDNQIDQRIVAISSVIFEILKILSRNDKFCEPLIHNLDFLRMMQQYLFNQDRTQLPGLEEDMKLMQIMNHLIAIDEEESKVFLTKYGVSIFLINLMLSTKLNKRVRVEAVKILRAKLLDVKAIIGSFVPVHFFTQIASLKGDYYLTHNEDDQVYHLLECLDADYFENLFIRWNSDLRDQQSQKVKEQCETILKELSEREEDLLNYDANLPTDVFLNPLCVNEIQVQEIICRLFNKNPSLPISGSLNGFVILLCQQLDFQIFSLEQMLQIFTANKQEFYGNNDDFMVQIRSEVFTLKTVKHKFLFQSQQTLQVLTALLLILEQVSQNSYNPNKQRNDYFSNEFMSRSQYGKDQATSHDSQSYALMNNRQSISQNHRLSQAGVPSYSANNRNSSFLGLNAKQQQLQNELNILLIDDVMSILPLQFMKFVDDWLRLPLFHSSVVPLELRITFMQLLILTMEIPNIVEDLSEPLLIFSAQLLEQIVSEVVDKLSVEDIIKVTVVERMLMRGGKDQILKFYNYGENLNNVRRIYFMSKKLVAIMSQMEIFKHIFTFLQMNAESEPLNWKDLASLPLRIDLSPDFQLQEFVKLWRPRPITQTDARKFYLFQTAEGYSPATSILEDKLEEPPAVSKLKNLPFLSIKSVAEIKRSSKKSKKDIPIKAFIEDLEQLNLKDQFWEQNKPIDFDFFNDL